MRILILFFYMTLSLVAITQASAQGIIYVDSSKTAGANNGSSWANAYADLQSALTAATGANVIWVAKGTYYPNRNIDGSATTGRDATFYINKDGLKIYGGFAGTEMGLADRNIAANPTVLSGDIGTAGDTSDNARNVLYIKGDSAAGNISAATVIDGFTIRDGNASGSDFNKSGGGAYINGSGAGNICNPTLANCTFLANNAEGNGGAVFVNGAFGSSSPTLTNCIFSGNSSAGNGGALSNSSSYGSSGATLINCNFLGNSTAGNGGAIYANSSYGAGSSVFTNCSFSGSLADLDGGAIYNNSESGSQNSVLTNCTFSGNGAGGGGAIFNDDSTVTTTLRNCVILGNSSGIHNNDNANTTITYSLVQDDTATADGNISSMGINASDVFVNPVVHTSAPATSGDYRLKSGSPVIHMASNSLYEAADGNPGNNSLTNDTELGGDPRLAGSVIDMGAYEYATPLPVSFLSFTAYRDDNDVKLQWSTASEANNTGFVIERSIDGQNWKQIDFVVTQADDGNSSATLNYYYTDMFPERGMSFYRLRQIDIDGRYSYSPVRTVFFNREQTISLYPNPVKDELWIAGLTGKENIQVSDLAGRVSYQTEAASGLINIPMKNFVNGAYYVRITAEDGTVSSFKLIVAK